MKILVTGSSGYSGHHIILELASKYPDAKIIGMSRSGAPRVSGVMDKYPNVSYRKGNCLEPETYKGIFKDIDACIHTVGVLFFNNFNA